MKVTIPTQMLAAIAPFMASRDVRYYLNGLLLEVEGNTVRAIATDGSALGVCRVITNGNSGRDSVILPRDLVEKLIKHKGAQVELTIVDAAITADVGGTGYTATVIDGRFPEWRAVMSEIADGGDCGVTMLVPELLGQVVKAAKVFKNATLELQPRPDKQSMRWRLAALPGGWAVAGVVMPANLVRDQRPAETL